MTPLSRRDDLEQVASILASPLHDSMAEMAPFLPTPTNPGYGPQCFAPWVNPYLRQQHRLDGPLVHGKP